MTTALILDTSESIETFIFRYRCSHHGRRLSPDLNLTPETLEDTPSSPNLSEAQIQVEAAKFVGDTTAWCDWWLKLFTRMFFDRTEPLSTIALLTRKGWALTFELRGLEHLFPEHLTDTNQQKALKALLQDVPEWLRINGRGYFRLAIFGIEALIEPILDSKQRLPYQEFQGLHWKPPVPQDPQIGGVPLVHRIHDHLK